MVVCSCDPARMLCRIALILSYRCATHDVAINYTVVLMTTTIGFVVRKDWKFWLGATAAFWVYQIVLCLILQTEECTGISIVWSAQMGLLWAQRDNDSQRAKSINGGLFATSLCCVAVWIYYAMTDAAITSIAHAAAVAMGYAVNWVAARFGDYTRTTHPIRTGAVAEAQTVTAVINTVYAVAEGDIWSAGPAFRRTNEEEVAGLLCANEILVADDRNGTVVGCIRWHAATSAQGVAEFGMLCVQAAHRKAGLGAQLVREAERRARLAGYRMMQCELLVPCDGRPHESKDRLRRWYPTLGYKLAADRIQPFEQAYPSLVASFGLARPSQCYYYEKRL